jgi:hypothetical protein
MSTELNNHLEHGERDNVIPARTFDDAFADVFSDVKPAEIKKDAEWQRIGNSGFEVVV